MESPILMSSNNIPIIVHSSSSKLNKNSMSREKSSKSTSINRRPTIASSFDLINLSSSNNQNETFITTNTKITTNNDNYDHKLNNSSSNMLFHANDSFFLHKGQNLQNNIRQFGIINGEAYASPNMHINHTKTIFDNIKNEQQRLIEQANYKTNIIENNIETPHSQSHSQSSITIPINNDKPKKRVSFNENLLEVHLIPTNESNMMMDEENNFVEEQQQHQQQTTYSSIATPNIANAKKLFQSTRFYKTTRPLTNNRQLIVNDGIPGSDFHILNELKRNNSNYSPSTSSLRQPYFKVNQPVRSSSMLGTQRSSNDEGLNDNKSLFKLSIKTIKFNNGSVGSSSSNGITIQPITENSIKSVMTIEPLNIKPKGKFSLLK
jgi:hypothetical protein